MKVNQKQRITGLGDSVSVLNAEGNYVMKGKVVRLNQSRCLVMGKHRNSLWTSRRLRIMNDGDCVVRASKRQELKAHPAFA